MERKKICKARGRAYYDYQNLGNWSCYQHAQIFDKIKGVYPCCNRSLGQYGDIRWNGCVRCDHTDYYRIPYNHFHDILLKSDELSKYENILIEAASEIIIIQQHNNIIKYKICRFDSVEFGLKSSP